LSTYSVFDLNIQVELTTGGAGNTEKSKTKHPRVPRAPRVLLSLNTNVKYDLIALSVFLSDQVMYASKQLAQRPRTRNCKPL